MSATAKPNVRLSLRHFGIAALALPAVLGTVPLAASAEDLITEIIVTAQRREQQLQTVPLAVTAFNDKQLESLNVTEALDVGRVVPNLIAHNNTGLGTANAYSLRGLNNTESIATFDPPVGTYIDDVYVARQNGNNFTLFDVDRIEALRGPQGTLFGRNTTGGAIRIILKKPAEELGGYIQAGYGEFDRIEGKANIDIPFGDVVRTKFSGYWIEDEGYVKNTTLIGATLNGEENWGARAAVLVSLSDDISLDLSYDYESTDHANIANSKDGSQRVTRTGFSENGGALSSLLTNNKRTFGLGNEVDASNVQANLELRSELGTTNLILGWREMEQEFALDFLNGNAAARIANNSLPPPWGGFTIANTGDHDQLTAELKHTGTFGDNIEYVGGIYWFDEDNRTDFGDIFDLNLGGGTFIPLVLADRVLENNTEALAGYFQADIKTADNVVLTLGVRYTDEDKDIAYFDNQPKAACAPFAPPVCTYVDSNSDGIADDDLTSFNMANQDLFTRVLDPGNLIPDRANIPLSQTEQIWTPRAALQYIIDDDRNLFISATRGFKSGGWNARGTTPDQLLPFSSEVVWSYEGGLRSQWLDDKLRFNVTAFWLEADDFQVPSAFTDASGAIQFITKNFATLRNHGFEVEVLATPVDDLNLLLQIGTQASSYRNLSSEIRTQQQNCLNGIAVGNNCGRGIVAPDGSIADPTRTPNYSINAGGNYTFSIGPVDITPSAYVLIVGEHSVFTSGNPGFINEGYTTFDASLAAGFDAFGGRMSVKAECNNCNDRLILVSGLAGVQYFQDPRTWLASIRYAFGRD